MGTRTVTIVTGASQGIGQATALRLARDFSAIVLVARSKDHLEKTAREVKSAGAEAVVHAPDLREPQAAAAVEGICRVYVWKRCSRSETWICGGGGDERGDDRTGKGFRREGIRDGVQVNSVVPGAVMNGRRQSFFEKWAPAHNLTVEEGVKEFPEEAGISRFGRPEEIADLLGYLVSPAAKWMTGTSVRMDGGEIKGV